MYRLELFRGNCIGGKSPGVIVLEEISWGVIVQRAVVQGKLSQFKYLFFEVICSLLLKYT